MSIASVGLILLIVIAIVGVKLISDCRGLLREILCQLRESSARKVQEGESRPEPRIPLEPHAPYYQPDPMVKIRQ